MRVLLFLLAFIESSSSFADPRPRFSGKIFEMGKDVPVYLVHAESEKLGNGSESLQTTFTLKDSHIEMIETTEVFINDGNLKLLSYSVDQRQVGAKGEMTVQDGRVRFKYEKNGKILSADESVDNNLTVGPTLVPFMREHWNELMRGEAIKIRYAVLDRQETIGFDLVKWSDPEVPASQVVIKMKPSSIVVSAVVEPLYFQFSADGSQLTHIKGQAPLKIKTLSGYEDFQAFSTYQVAQ